jgi:hypothetical protein
MYNRVVPRRQEWKFVQRAGMARFRPSSFARVLPRRVAEHDRVSRILGALRNCWSGIAGGDEAAAAYESAENFRWQIDQER